MIWLSTPCLEDIDLFQSEGLGRDHVNGGRVPFSSSRLSEIGFPQIEPRRDCYSVPLVGRIDAGKSQLIRYAALIEWYGYLRCSRLDEVSRLIEIKGNANKGHFHQLLTDFGTGTSCYLTCALRLLFRYLKSIKTITKEYCCENSERNAAQLFMLGRMNTCTVPVVERENNRDHFTSLFQRKLRNSCYRTEKGRSFLKEVENGNCADEKFKINILSALPRCPLNPARGKDDSGSWRGNCFVTESLMRPIDGSICMKGAIRSTFGRYKIKSERRVAMTKATGKDHQFLKDGTTLSQTDNSEPASLDELESIEVFQGILDAMLETGTKIRTRRKNLGYTLSDFARMVGINKSHLSRIENGRDPASFSVYWNIAQNLGTTMEYLFHYDDEIEKPSEVRLDSLSAMDERNANEERPQRKMEERKKRKRSRELQPA